MKHLRWLLLLSFILIGKTSYAQEKKLLWEISNDDSVVYLMGTIHALASFDYPLDQYYEKAYSIANRIVFEVDFDELETRAVDNYIQNNGVFPIGQNIRPYISNSTYNMLKEYAVSEGLNLNDVLQYKPWINMLNLSHKEILEAGLDPTLGVDQHFFDKANRDNKNVLGLESVIDQLKVFAEIPLNKQGDYLGDQLKNFKSDVKETRDLVDFWRDSDLQKFDSMVEEIREEDNYLYDRVLRHRNNKWVPKIVNYLNSPGITTVFAGSLHFAGSDSVIKLLKNKNYKATRLPAPPRLIDDPDDQTLNESSNVTFSAKFRSLSSTSYQWFHNGQAIVNAKASTLTINSATENDAGNYVLKATNMSGTSSTLAVQLKVKSKNKLPVIVETYPVSGSVFEAGEEFKPYVICYDPDGTIKKIAIVNTVVPKSTWINLPNGKIKAIRPIGVRGSEPNTSYDIDFVVEDNSGAVVEHTVNFRAIKQNQPPVIVETYPISGSKFEAGEKFRPYVICYDPDGTIKKITIADRTVASGWVEDVPKSTWANLANSQIKATLPFSIWGPNPNNSYSIVWVVEDDSGAVVEHTVTFITFKQDAPAITKQPEDKEIHHGENVEFNIAASGTQPLEFQWYKNGEQIEGATGTVLKLDNVTKADEAIYSVRIINEFGKSYSRIAQLIVREDPPTITLQPKDRKVFVGADVEFQVIATGTGILEYQWYKDGKQIEGAKTSLLKLNKTNDDDEANYSVTIKNTYGNIVSDNATLIVSVKPPTITLQPNSRSVVLGGDSVTFSVAASGAQPMSYRWRRNGVFLGPATESPTFELKNVQPEQAGIYRAVVSNIAGEVMSEAAELVVIGVFHTITVAMLNSDGADSEVWVTLSAKDRNGQLGGTTPFTRTYSKGSEAKLTAQLSRGGKWFTKWLKNGEPIGTEPTVSVRVDSDFTLRAVYAPPHTLTVASQNPDRGVTVTVQKGWSGKRGDTTPFARTYSKGSQLTLTAEQVVGYRFKHWLKNGEPIGTEPTVTVTLDWDYTLRAVYELGRSPVFVNQPVVQKVAANTTATFSVSATGTAPLDFQWDKNGTPIERANEPTLTLEDVHEVDEGIYSVRVKNDFGEAISETAKLEVFGYPPTINDIDNLIYAYESQSTELSVKVMGSRPFIYEWYKIWPIPNLDILSTSEVLPLNNLQLDDSGKYMAIISNEYGKFSSDSITLTILEKIPKIIKQPEAKEVLIGDKITFSTNVTGVAPINYQWFKNGEFIVGALDKRYAIDLVRVGDAGDYHVMATNEHGVIKSETVTLTLKDTPPLIISGKTCYFFEWYDNSEAVMIHTTTFGEKFAERLLGMIEIQSFEVFGNPNAEAKKELSGFGASFHKSIGGFAR